jgi:putative pyruvate formate lyase activating enzyme
LAIIRNYCGATSLWRIVRPDALEVLGDEKCRRSLKRYFTILEGHKHAKFRVAKRLEVDFSPHDSLETLWNLHEKFTSQYYELEEKLDSEGRGFESLSVPKLSYLDLKTEIARRMLEDCHFCERRCKVNRLKGEKGFCRCGTQVEVSSYFAHLGEEPELVPSGTIFTMGCTVRCLHCQNWTISQWFEKGEKCSPGALAQIVRELKRQGCRNANLVGGEPTPWLAAWLETFNSLDLDVPVVWNSNSYYSEEAAKLLSGFADIYLLDFKYGNNGCAERISSAPKYVETARRNHLYALKYGELIIRVLVLPGHIECCAKPILKWIAKNLGTQVRVNIMDQYRPEWRAGEIPELKRRLKPEEFREVLSYAKEIGLTNLCF